MSVKYISKNFLISLPVALEITPNSLDLLPLAPEKHRQGFEKLNLLIGQQHYENLTCLFTVQQHLKDEAVLM